MKRFFGFAPVLALLGNTGLFAQQPAAAPLTYSGSGPSETTVFTARDRWQAAWSGTAASVTIENASGAALAGAGGAAGTLYMPSGGSFKIRIVPTGSAGGAWTLNITQAGSAGGTVSGDAASTYVPPDMTFASGTGVQPAIVPAFNPTPSAAPSAAAPGGDFKYATPSPVGTGASKLSESQSAAMVIIRGDKGEGTGFLVRNVGGSFVITNQHVIGANPHVKITTTSGEDVPMLGLLAASDRDLAMIQVQDNHFTYLQLDDALGAGAPAGEPVITPGNSEGGGVMLTSNGAVLALGPQKIEISNPVYHGNSGGPIIEAKSGKVAGVVTMGMLVNVDNVFDKASFSNPKSPITSSVRYFGMRLDNVPEWMSIPWNRFENETEFLEEFQERSKCIDSLLNSRHDSSEFGSYYLRDEKVKAAYLDYKEDNGLDTHRIDQVRALISTLMTLTDENLADMQNPESLYPFDRERAKQQVQFRTALRKELESLSNDVSRLTDMGRTFK